MSTRSPLSYTHRPRLTLRLVRKRSRAPGYFSDKFICMWISKKRRFPIQTCTREPPESRPWSFPRESPWVAWGRGGGSWAAWAGALPSTGRGPAPPTHAPRQCRQSCHAGALSLGLVAGCRHPIPPDLGPSDNQTCGIKSGPQIFPAPHHGQSQPTSSPQPPGPRGLAGPPAAPNPPRAWTGGLPPELQLGAGRPTSPTRQITYHLPGKAHLGASMGGLWGVAHRLHTPPTRRRAGNTKASPMHASYVCRVSRPRTEVVAWGRNHGYPADHISPTRQNPPGAALGRCRVGRHGSTG